MPDDAELKKSKIHSHMDKERWKPISGYPDYRASNKGRIKSFKRGNPRIINGCIDSNGYCIIALTGPNGRKNKRRGRIVAKTFINNPKNKPEVNHIDGNKSNDAVSNLEWATRSENHKHAFDSGLMKKLYKSVSRSNRGTNNCNSKLNDRKVREIKYLLTNSNLKQYEIAEIYKVDESIISGINVGKIWGHVKGMQAPRKSATVLHND